MARLSHARDLKSFNDAPLGVFLEPDGKLPGFAQRRVDSLISKKKTARLSADEEGELSEALDYIDTKSVQLLKSGLIDPDIKPGRGTPKASHKK